MLIAIVIGRQDLSDRCLADVVCSVVCPATSDFAGRVHHELGLRLDAGERVLQHVTEVLRNVGELGVARDKSAVLVHEIFDFTHYFGEIVVTDPSLEGYLAVTEEERLIGRKVEIQLHLQRLRELTLLTRREATV